MRKTVSCVITTKNEAGVISDLLDSLKKQIFRNFEIILVDNNSTDNTTGIAKKFGCKIYNCGPERSAQRNFGVKKAEGEYIVILDADMTPSPGVLKECVDKFNSDSKLGALVIPEKSVGEGFWSKCRAFEREFYVGEDDIEAARCFRKKLFLDFEGYDEKLTGPEDWDLPLRMKKGGVNVGRIKNYILHNEKRFSPIKSAKKKFYYAARIRRYFKKHPEMLLKQGNTIFRFVFIRKWRKLLTHPILAVGVFVIKFCEGLGALFGIVYSGIMRKDIL